MTTAIAEAPALTESLESLLPSVPSDEENWAKGQLVLPGGIFSETGSVHKVVCVRELTGADEELLGDRRYRNGVDLATEFLVRAVQRVEGIGNAVTEDLVAGMLIGDRDYLILRLRQMTMGDQVHQVLRCPNTVCGEKVDVEFLISDLPVRRTDDLQPRYNFELSCLAIPGDERSRRGVLRLPTGRDQSAIAELPDLNPGVANTRLFSRVILEIGGRAKIDEVFVRSLPMKVRSEITEFLRSNSPGPDLTIDVQCPHCGSNVAYPFDLYNFFFDEWLLNLDRLYQDIHTLAFHYHWSEREILAMTRAKRNRFLSLLVRQFEHSGNGGGSR